MGERLLLDIDANGVAEYGHFDSDGNLEALEWCDDVESVLEANKINKTDGTSGYGPSREWKHEARIPLSLVRQWEVELGVPMNFLETKEGMPILLKKLRDPDYSLLRTDK